MDAYVRQLMKFAASEGVEVIARSESHYQIIGKLLVNYYPTSKMKTAYVAGTTEGKKHVTPQQAVQMALFAPKTVAAGKTDKRSKNSRKIRIRMFGGKETMPCHWCRTAITLDTSTIEHVIPLKRGGLDNANNRVLACEPCNQERGHSMPELNQPKRGNK